MSSILAHAKNGFWTFLHKRCLVGFPWFWPARFCGVPEMMAGRYLVRRNFASDHRPVARFVARVLTASVYVPALVIDLWQAKRQDGPKGVPTRLMPGALWTAIRHNVLPSEYFAYQLWRPERRKKIDSYLYSHEAPRLFKILNKPVLPDPIGDKLEFFRLCSALKIPTPKVLAAFSPTGKRIDDGPEEFWNGNLFVKPRFGFSGAAAERFRANGNFLESNRGHRLRPQDLPSYVRQRAEKEKQALLIQPALANHPDLHLEPDAALAAVRLVTGLALPSDVQNIFGFIYFGRPARITSQHGYMRLIDVSTGRVQLLEPSEIATSLGPASIADKISRVPDWDLAVKLVHAIHRACTNVVFVGWDIAFTSTGPVLLEGNANWNADEYQSLTGTPLGETNFASILDHELEATDGKRHKFKKLGLGPNRPCLYRFLH